MILPDIMTIIRTVHQLYSANNCARALSRTANYGSAGTPVILFDISNPLYRETTCATTLCTGS